MVYLRGCLGPVLRFLYGLFKGLFGTSFKVCLRSCLGLFYGCLGLFMACLRGYLGPVLRFV